MDTRRFLDTPILIDADELADPEKRSVALRQGVLQDPGVSQRRPAEVASEPWRTSKVTN